ncbi:FAD-dependent monooxygenase [Promicromonospora sukumoe]|uniref:2-polyprenyl-6-methoxyphenol hydroxylase-like FAD-dependent oxidoreductase n=1 Tax=Promicromonospora sukumoe TaxID=88382 RepID=A0A7W3J7S8_9MICO|nr:FAD-dependent monooxygenase [Promicromonospora sukumoe]MBA8807865.1 2-polyprenyl-6-methoxyphenol hydroxylase-like FAD-dependent oxidoreductase [Promicromonospora sukumoe]
MTSRSRSASHSAPHPAPRTVLVVGASIAGPTLAYWLHRSGFAVTVVEKAHAPRGGGYPIDVRGTALDVVRRMGVLPRLRAAHVDTGRFTFLDADGGEIVSLHPSAVARSVEGQGLEVARGDLTAALYATVRDDVELRFDDHVTALDEHQHGVDVTFRSGARRTFDLVVGADGVHSGTRALAFGPEDRFHRYLGYAFAVFTMPNTLGLTHELMMWSAPGRAAALYATGGADDAVHAFLNFHRPALPSHALRDPDAQRDLVTSAYAGAGRQVAGIVDAMHEADDLFFDTAGQIRMPRWSSGRVALVGDAAFAPSFLTGQGSSLALVGAYMLARSLAEHRSHVAAFAAYERDTREFVTKNQALVADGGARLFPTTAEALERRNTMLRALVAMPGTTPEPAHSELVLPEPAAPWPGRGGKPHLTRR